MSIKRTVLVCFLGAALLLLPAALRPSQDPAVPAAAAPGLRYEIWVELDDADKMLLGREELVWTNTSGEPVPDIVFHLYWNAFKNEDSAFLREAMAETGLAAGASPKDGEWGWVDITDIRLADGTDLKPSLAFITPDGPEHPGDQTVLRVLLPAPAAPGENPGFYYGCTPTGGTPIYGTTTSANYTPTLVTLSKAFDGPENETATGPNYPRRFTISVEVAPGQTVTLGTTRIAAVAGGYEQASYALRAFLDESGCGLPGTLQSSAPRLTHTSPPHDQRTCWRCKSPSANSTASIVRSARARIRS